MCVCTTPYSLMHANVVESEGHDKSAEWGPFGPGKKYEKYKFDTSITIR